MRSPERRSGIQIITDQMASLPVSKQEQYGIIVARAVVDNLGTSAPNPEEYRKRINEAADRLEEKGIKNGEVLILTVAKKQSESHNFAKQVAREISKDGKRVNVNVIETGSASLGEALVVLKIAELVTQGATMGQVTREAKEIKAKVSAFFTVERFRHPGGKLKNIVREVVNKGRYINVAPLLTMKDGDIGLRLTRGRRIAISKIAEHAAQKVDLNFPLIGLMEYDCEEKDLQLLEKTFVDLVAGNDEQKASEVRAKIIRGKIDEVTAFHIGTGTLGLAIKEI